MHLAFWLPNIISVIINLILFFTVYRMRNKQGAVSGLVMIFCIIGWSLSESFLWLGLDRPWLLVISRIQYLFIISVIFAFLFFVIYFTGRGIKMPVRRLWPLLIPPVLLLILIWTNERHELFYRSFEIAMREGIPVYDIKYGPVFFIWTLYAYTLVIWSLVLLVRSYMESSEHYRKQYLAVLAGVLIPISANLLYLFDLYPFSHFDITPMAYTGTALFLAWAVFRKRMFDLQPIARREVFSLMSDGALVLDTDERVVDINPAAVTLFGFSEEEAIGQYVEELFSDDPILTGHLKESGTHMVSIVSKGEIRFYSLSNSKISDRRGLSMGRIVVLRDMTEQKILEKKLEIQAGTDSLTGVLNRRHFTELAEKEQARSHRKGSSLALLLLDVDHFKGINDNYGHHTGDRVLKALTESCTQCLRESDLLGRWGGEEFIILLPETELDTAAIVAQRLREKVMKMRLPVSEENESGESIGITISLGLTVVRADDASLDEAFKRADKALYRSKQEGRNRVSSS